MRKLTFHAGLLACSLLAVATDASAQPPSRLGRPTLRPTQRPVTSPYLNLLQGNQSSGNFTFEYFRRVRPEMEFRRNDALLSQSVQNLQYQFDQQQSSAEAQVITTIGPTGHQASFQNYGRYYNSMGQASSGGQFQSRSVGSRPAMSTQTRSSLSSPSSGLQGQSRQLQR